MLGRDREPAYQPTQKTGEPHHLERELDLSEEGRFHSWVLRLLDLTDTYQTLARKCWDGQRTPDAKC